MKEIPTAEEFLNNYRFEAGEHIGNRDLDTIIKFAKDFTKLHVEAALKAASENVIIDTFVKNRNKRWIKKEGEFDFDPTYFEHKYAANKKSILTAYPFDKIK